MSEKPILFSGPMVRAILDGSKTQTRRVVKPQPVSEPNGRNGATVHYWDKSCAVGGDAFELMQGMRDHCPYGKPGDELWVRETWAVAGYYDRIAPTLLPEALHEFDGEWLPNVGGISFAADDGPFDPDLVGRWRPSIHMPRWASRIQLRITDVRVERLNEISEDDSQAEGVEPMDAGGWKEWRDYKYASVTCVRATTSFSTLWDTINGTREGCSWDDNPWVWVVGFERKEAE